MADDALADLIRRRIRDDGPLPLDAFWRLAMTTPEHGYYMRGAPIGAEGDFTTAPEISQIFGELLGLWLVDAWMQAGSPDPFTLMELGPGRGQLMADALRAARAVPAFAAAATTILVEASPTLRAEQQRRLTDMAPTWHADWAESLAAARGQPLFLIANEFLDALPIRQFVFDGAVWRERLIAAADASFVFENGPATDLPEDATPPAGAPPEGGVYEYAPERAAVARAVAERIAAEGGAALFVDYGHAGARLGDSLQALAGGRPADPLEAPGQADITSHVDFGAIGIAAAAGGGRLWGPVEQGVFLLRLGAEARATALAKRADAAGAAAVEQGLRRLIHPLAMGTLFKVAAILAAGHPAPAGFE